MTMTIYNSNNSLSTANNSCQLYQVENLSFIERSNFKNLSSLLGDKGLETKVLPNK